MNLSTETANILKNFATINPNIVMQPGSEIKTISEAKNILAKASIREQIPVEFGIYDLNEFLNVVQLFDEPVLLFPEEGKSVRIADASKKQQVTYYFSDKSILTSPQKDISMPVSDVEFIITNEQMSSLRRAASTLGVSDVVITGSDSNITISVKDLKDPTSNQCDLEMKDYTNNAGEFTAIFNIANLKFIQSEYRVELTSNLISHFSSTTLPVEYWVALEKSSTFN